jgi:hypothetical protein
MLEGSVALFSPYDVMRAFRLKVPLLFFPPILFSFNRLRRVHTLAMAMVSAPAGRLLRGDGRVNVMRTRERRVPLHAWWPWEVTQSARQVIEKRKMARHRHAAASGMRGRVGKGD